MKTITSFNKHLPRAAAIAAALLAVLPLAASAKDRDDDRHDHDRGHDSKSKHHDDHRDNDNDRRSYISRPRSSFTLSLGNGYAGRGYYYGPANSGYYYERPEVRYYATREAAPREYYSSNRTEVAVQRALAREGYYRGPIDGDIGPGSRNAIARYQARHGLRPTGLITPSLLESLGLR